jgi:hypothetical protein
MRLSDVHARQWRLSGYYTITHSRNEKRARSWTRHLFRNGVLFQENGALLNPVVVPFTILKIGFADKYETSKLRIYGYEGKIRLPYPANRS